MFENAKLNFSRLAQILLKIQSSIILGEEPRPNGINIPAPQVSDLINLHDTQVCTYYALIMHDAQLLIMILLIISFY